MVVKQKVNYYFSAKDVPTIFALGGLLILVIGIGIAFFDKRGVGAILIGLALMFIGLIIYLKDKGYI